MPWRQEPLLVAYCSIIFLVPHYGISVVLPSNSCVPHGGNAYVKYGGFIPWLTVTSKHCYHIANEWRLVFNKDFVKSLRTYSKMAHQCREPLFWPPWIILYQLFVATIIPSLVTVLWIVWMSGPTCTKTGSPHCLGSWYAMLMPCVNYWACTMVHMYLFYPLMKREILLTTFVRIEILRLFIMYHPVDIWHFYFSLSTSIHCDSMCFY